MGARRILFLLFVVVLELAAIVLGSARSALDVALAPPLTRSLDSWVRGGLAMCGELELHHHRRFKIELHQDGAHGTTVTVAQAPSATVVMCQETGKQGEIHGHGHGSEEAKQWLPDAAADARERCAHGGKASAAGEALHQQTKNEQEGCQARGHLTRKDEMGKHGSEAHKSSTAEAARAVVDKHDEGREAGMKDTAAKHDKGADDEDAFLSVPANIASADASGCVCVWGLYGGRALEDLVKEDLPRRSQQVAVPCSSFSLRFFRRFCGGRRWWSPLPAPRPTSDAWSSCMHSVSACVHRRRSINAMGSAKKSSLTCSRGTCTTLLPGQATSTHRCFACRTLACKSSGLSTTTRDFFPFFFFLLSVHHLHAASKQDKTGHHDTTLPGADSMNSSPPGFQHRVSSCIAGDVITTYLSVDRCGYYFRLSRLPFNRRIARSFHLAVLASGDISAIHRRVCLRLRHRSSCNLVCEPLCNTAFSEGPSCTLAA